jgi:ribonuclease P protein component
VYRFNSTRRLIKKSDFDHVFSKAKKIVIGHITLLCRPNSLSYARLGFAISKRFAAKAVLRNKIRRQIKESFRVKTNLPAYDVVVLLNKPCDKQHIEQFMSKNIEQLWQKLSSL